MADDPDDEDKDRGRSTRTPGQTMTRAQMHRAAKAKDKLARSGTYGNIGINPNPGTAKAWAPKVIEGRNVQTKFDRMGHDGHVRAITTSGASGAVGVDLDISRSQMWLAEVSPILGLMNVAMGINSEYQVWYGGTAPTGSAVAEGGAHTENDPTLTRLRRTPVVLHMPWSVTGPMDAMDSGGISSLFESAVEQLILEQVLRQVLSGPNTGADFAADANSITGLWGSGIVHTGFGAAADTEITAFDRPTVTAPNPDADE